MLPKQFTLDGYVKVITSSPFFRWMGNSLFVTVIDTQLSFVYELFDRICAVEI